MNPSMPLPVREKPNDPPEPSVERRKTGDNDCRYRRGRNHVESWFVRANHPTRPRALWIKATILGRSRGESVAEAWCSLFDGERTRAGGARETVPIDEATFRSATAHAPFEARIGAARFALGEETGRAQGTAGPFHWDLTWQRLPGPLGDPLCLLPTRMLIDSPLPRNKLLTPAPVLRISGSVGWGGERWDVEDWLGMQGHNWGEAHSPEYAWGHCIFSNARGEPFCVVEGASGRVKIGPWTTPVLSLLTIRRGERTYRFDRLVDLWNQEARIAFPRWHLRMRGPDGEAVLSMEARPDRMVCLGYDNPRGARAFCLNSKLAAVRLRVNPADDDGFECRSDHSGALEFLRPEPIAELPDVV